MATATASSSLAHHAPRSRSMAGGHNPWLVAIVVSLATFMEVLDTSIANVSLTHIAGELSASLDESTWVLTSYLVSNAIVLPISGWLANVVGRKRFYMACVFLFTASSFLCGLAPSLGWLIVFRVLQGLGGGGLAPSEQAILADSFPPAKRGMAFALYGVAVVVAPAVGPTLGGWITDNYQWRWIFFINVPVGVLSLVLVHIVLHEPHQVEAERKKRVRSGKLRIDYVGFGLVAVGFGALQIVLDKGQREDWFQSHFIQTFTTVSVIAVLAMIIWEFHRKDPIVDIRLFKNLNFAVSNTVMFAMGFILFGTTQLLPQLTQTLLGYTAMLAGEVISPGGFAVLALMPLVGYLLKHIQPKWLILIGLCIETASLLYMSTFSLDVGYGKLAWARVIQASGLAFLFVPISTIAYAGLAANKTNQASAMINLSRNLGGSFGISIAQTWLARRQQFHQNFLVAHAHPGNPVYDQRVSQMAHRFAAASDPVTAMRQAVGTIFSQIQRQASMLAYIDIFHWMAIAAALTIPLIFLLRTIDLGKAQAAH
jgi:DHA2 family multidrug resistance protein